MCGNGEVIETVATCAFTSSEVVLVSFSEPFSARLTQFSSQFNESSSTNGTSKTEAKKPARVLLPEQLFHITRIRFPIVFMIGLSFFTIYVFSIT